MTNSFVMDGDMETGLALVRLFTERWGAEVIDYDATPQGDVVVNVVVPTNSGGLRRDRRQALIRQNQRHILRLRDRMEAVEAFVYQTWQGHAKHAISIAFRPTLPMQELSAAP